MSLQKVFKDTYVNALRTNIVVGNYALEEFPYDESKVRYLANVEKPEGLLEKLEIDNDFNSAIALYEAYEEITPLIASKQDFWTYLTHVDLFPYVQKRWSNVLSGSADTSYIEEHWFYSKGGAIRTTLMGLWWSVYCSVDYSRGDNKYELTKLLFKHADFRTRRFGNSTLFRHKEAVIGILEFLNENRDVHDSYFEGRFLYITKYFNRLGAVKQLAYLDRNFFKSELCRIKSTLLNIRSREDVLNV